MSSIGGYAEYQLFQDVIDTGSSFIGRIRDNAVWTVVEERPVSAGGPGGWGRSDRVVHLGGDKSGAVFKQPVRVLEVETGKTDSQGGRKCCSWPPDRLDLEAEHVCPGVSLPLGGRTVFPLVQVHSRLSPLLSTSPNGITIQLYLGIIASLSISLWTGKKPTKRPWRCSSSTSRAWPAK